MSSFLNRLKNLKVNLLVVSWFIWSFSRFLLRLDQSISVVMKVIQHRSVHSMKRFVNLLSLSRKLINWISFKGFLCPVCHRKFRDTTGLENHYLQAHSQADSAAASNYSDTNGNKYDETVIQNNEYQRLVDWIVFVGFCARDGCMETTIHCLGRKSNAM